MLRGGVSPKGTSVGRGHPALRNVKELVEVKTIIQSFFLARVVRKIISIIFCRGFRGKNNIKS